MVSSSHPKSDHGAIPPTRYGFLIMPGFSMIAFAAAIDALRLANRVSGETLYTWETLSVDGKPVMASNGIEVSPNRSSKQPARYAALFVCGGIRIHQTWTPALGECPH